MSGKVYNLTSARINQMNQFISRDIRESSEKGPFYLPVSLSYNLQKNIQTVVHYLEDLTMSEEAQPSSLQNLQENAHDLQSFLSSEKRIIPQSLYLLAEIKKNIETVIEEMKMHQIAKSILYNRIWSMIQSGKSKDDIITYFNEMREKTIQKDNGSAMDYLTPSLQYEVNNLEGIFEESDIYEILYSLILIKQDLIQAENGWNDEDLEFQEEEDIIISSMGSEIARIPARFFEDTGLSNEEIEEKKQRFVEAIDISYDARSKLMRLPYDPLPQDTKSTLEYDAFDLALSSTENKDNSKEEFLEFLKARLFEGGEEYGISDEEIQQIFEKFKKLMTSKEGEEKRSEIIGIIFTGLVIFHPEEGTRFETLTDITANIDFFRGEIWKKLSLLGYANNLSAYGQLKKYDFQKKFKEIRENLYPKIWEEEENREK